MPEQLKVLDLFSGIRPADFLSDLNALECELSPFAKLSLSAEQCCASIGLTFRNTTTYERSPQKDLSPMGSGQLTLFAGDSHVSHSATPEKEWVEKITAPSGRNIEGLSKNFGPLGCLEKTLLASLAWASTPCLMTWKAWATPQGRLIFRLARLERSTKDGGYGLWPTPLTIRKNDSDNTAGRFYQKKNQFDLAAAVALWPTPAATDARGGVGLMLANKRAAETTFGKRLPEEMAVRDQVDVRGSLNPAWVEWLMGYPIGHTDLGHSETQSYRKSRKSSAKQS